MGKSKLNVPDTAMWRHGLESGRTLCIAHTLKPSPGYRSSPNYIVYSVHESNRRPVRVGVCMLDENGAVKKAYRPLSREELDAIGTLPEFLAVHQVVED